MAENHDSKLSRQQEVVEMHDFELINRIARNLYLAHGEYVGETYSFRNALTPLGKRCWDAATLVYHNNVATIPEVQSLLFGELVG